jgi:hypothetical protein
MGWLLRELDTVSLRRSRIKRFSQVMFRAYCSAVKTETKAHHHSQVLRLLYRPAEPAFSLMMTNTFESRLPAALLRLVLRI